MPSSSQPLTYSIAAANEENVQITSAPARASASSVASAIQGTKSTKHTNTKSVTLASNNTTPLNDTNPGSGQTGSLENPTNCGISMKRSWIFRGRIAAHLHVRECLASSTLEPASALVPNAADPLKSDSSPQSAPSSEAQTAGNTQQTDTQAAKNTEQNDSQTSKDSEQADSQATKNTEQAQSQPSQDTEQVASQAVKDTQQADSHTVDNTQQAQVQSQPAKDAPPSGSEPMTPAVAPAPVNSPVVVQGQTVPADGNSITINNQVVRVSSGYVYVGSSSAPIPQPQATESHDEPIVAGALTFFPASPSQASQATLSPVVVGGLTFSAAQSKPPVEPTDTPDQPQAQPVVIGGKTYAPVSPTLHCETSQSEANVPNHDQSDNAVENDQSELDQLNPLPAQADSKLVVIGGMTYTPVAANTSPSSQSAAIFSFGVVAITQGGKAVTVSGTRISLGPSGALVGTSSSPFSTPAPSTSVLAVGSQTLTALRGSEGGFEIGHTTLLPGSSAVTIDGTTYSINEADSLIVGTSTIPLATAGTNDTSNSALTADGETFTPLGSTAVVIDGTTLSIGGSAITEHGTRLSLLSNGLLVGSSTFAYASPVINTATMSTASAFSSTGVVPSGGAMPVGVPSATGVVGSAASAKAKRPIGIMMCLGVWIYLSIIVGFS